MFKTFTVWSTLTFIVSDVRGRWFIRCSSKNFAVESSSSQKCPCLGLGKSLIEVFHESVALLFLCQLCTHLLTPSVRDAAQFVLSADKITLRLKECTLWSHSEWDWVVMAAAAKVGPAFKNLLAWCSRMLWIGRNCIFGRAGVCGEAASWFGEDFTFELRSKAHTNLKAAFSFSFVPIFRQGCNQQSSFFWVGKMPM